MSRELERQYYSVEEAATILGVHPETIRRMCRKGRLKGARQIGDTWRIPKTSVDAEPNTSETDKNI
jgi:excisionase family DNA binding protein